MVSFQQINSTVSSCGNTDYAHLFIKPKEFVVNRFGSGFESKKEKLNKVNFKIKIKIIITCLVLNLNCHESIRIHGFKKLIGFPKDH